MINNSVNCTNNDNKFSELLYATRVGGDVIEAVSLVIMLRTLFTIGNHTKFIYRPIVKPVRAIR